MNVSTDGLLVAARNAGKAIIADIIENLVANRQKQLKEEFPMSASTSTASTAGLLLLLSNVHLP